MASIRSIKRRKNLTRNADTYAGLQQEIKQMDGFENVRVVRNPRGEVKMSGVLEEFVEPYTHLGPDTFEARKKLLMLGIAAWNVALLPAEKQDASIGDLVVSLKGLGRRDKNDMKQLLKEMVARKDALFPDNKRFIISFTLEDRAGEWRLSVASTLNIPPLP